jgi:hypothetical protein
MTRHQAVQLHFLHLIFFSEVFILISKIKIFNFYCQHTTLDPYVYLDFKDFIFGFEFVKLFKLFSQLLIRHSHVNKILNSLF